MRLLDFDELTDADMTSLFDREVPCGYAQMCRDQGAAVPPTCTNTATRWVQVRCRRCGRGKRTVMCEPCHRVVRRVVRALRLLLLAIRHRSCPHRGPSLMAVTFGAL